MPLKKGLKPPSSIRWRDAVRTVKNLGAIFVRQVGDHKHYEIANSGATDIITIPVDNDIQGNLLDNIIRQTGVGKERFWEAFFKKK